MDSVSIPLSSRKYPGLYAIVDAEDYKRVSQHKWHPAKGKRTFYAAMNAKKEGGDPTQVLLHRFLLGAPEGTQIDHWNGNGLDCQRLNLRFATHQQNARNQRRRRGVSAPYRGLFYDSRGKRWRATIWHDGKGHPLGSGKDVESLARIYDRAAVRIFGEFARTNFDVQLPLFSD
jgi:hypothetical protein